MGEILESLPSPVDNCFSHGGYGPRYMSDIDDIILDDLNKESKIPIGSEYSSQFVPKKQYEPFLQQTINDIRDQTSFLSPQSLPSCMFEKTSSSDLLNGPSSSQQGNELSEKTFINVSEGQNDPSFEALYTQTYDRNTFKLGQQAHCSNYVEFNLGQQATSKRSGSASMPRYHPYLNVKSVEKCTMKDRTPCLNNITSSTFQRMAETAGNASRPTPQIDYQMISTDDPQSLTTERKVYAAEDTKGNHTINIANSPSSTYTFFQDFSIMSREELKALWEKRKLDKVCPKTPEKEFVNFRNFIALDDQSFFEKLNNLNFLTMSFDLNCENNRFELFLLDKQPEIKRLRRLIMYLETNPEEILFRERSQLNDFVYKWTTILKTVMGEDNITFLKEYVDKYRKSLKGGKLLKQKCAKLIKDILMNIQLHNLKELRKSSTENAIEFKDLVLGFVHFLIVLAR